MVRVLDHLYKLKVTDRLGCDSDARTMYYSGDIFQGHGCYVIRLSSPTCMSSNPSGGEQLVQGNIVEGA